MQGDKLGCFISRLPLSTFFGTGEETALRRTKIDKLLLKKWLLHQGKYFILEKFILIYFYLIGMFQCC